MGSCCPLPKCGICGRSAAQQLRNVVRHGEAVALLKIGNAFVVVAERCCDVHANTPGGNEGISGVVPFSDTETNFAKIVINYGIARAKFQRTAVVLNSTFVVSDTIMIYAAIVVRRKELSI